MRTIANSNAQLHPAAGAQANLPPVSYQNPLCVATYAQFYGNKVNNPFCGNYAGVQQHFNPIH